MFAYSHNRTKMTSVKQVTPGNAGIDEESFVLKPDPGSTERYTYTDGTVMDWDGQKDAIEHGQRVFVDDDGDEYPECALVYLDIDLDDPDAAPLDPATVQAFADAEQAYLRWRALDGTLTYSLPPPPSGWRQAGTFDDDEKELLRPIAETLAMLSGNAFFGLTTDAHGEDVLYEDYLPQAAALYESAGARAAQTSIAKAFISRRKNP